MPIVMLDSTPLGLLTHPANDRQCKKWVEKLVLDGIQVAIPQIIDYELRRELIRLNAIKSVSQLDIIKQVLPLVILDEEMMIKAAELWAWARKTNQQTAHNQNIDIDVILAAQAIVLAQQEQDYVVVATGNVEHIIRYTPAMFWQKVTTENCLKPKVAVLNKNAY
jgi:predicted nucleic acid-binding protein